MQPCTALHAWAATGVQDQESTGGGDYGQRQDMGASRHMGRAKKHAD